jgi:hypothetical protein
LPCPEFSATIQGRTTHVGLQQRAIRSTLPAKDAAQYLKMARFIPAACGFKRDYIPEENSIVLLFPDT